MKRFLACLIFDPAGSLADFSNYALTPFRLDGSWWKSVEHFYQAQKFPEGDMQAQIRGAENASRAKALAWSFSEVAPLGWHDKAPSVLLNAMRAKFANSTELSAALIRTWPLPILEDSLTDDFWGIGPDGLGKNQMGKSLECLRDQLVGEASPFVEVNIIQRPIFSNNSRFDTVNGLIYYNIHMYAKDILNKENPLLIEVQTSCENTNTSDDDHFNRPQAFENKYINYKWNDDARSCFTSWVDNALIFFTENSNIELESSLIIGAGVGEEVERLWSHIRNDKIAFSEIARGLCDNVCQSAGGRPCYQMLAEKLEAISSQSISTYIALRVYQSFGLDKVASAKECRRVLRAGGTAIISIANGYRDSSGAFVRGLINEKGEIDPSLHLYQAGETVDAMVAAGFELRAVDNWNTELVLLFQAPRVEAS